MNTLIERLEALTGPCGEVDGLIAIATGCILEKRNKDRQEWYYRPNGDRWNASAYSHGYGAMPRYTANIDSAMKLVPGGVGIALFCAKTGGASRAELENMSGREFFSDATTPAIALCIAALRAREATNA